MAEDKIAAAILTAITALTAGQGSQYSPRGEPEKVMQMYLGYLEGIEKGEAPDLLKHLRKQ
ncbi:MAG TPA: hypothetical protein VM182_11705 [Terriglobia bacterium]|nr:hypothetical protein [Terriglobia bacterium]